MLTIVHELHELTSLSSWSGCFLGSVSRIIWIQFGLTFLFFVRHLGKTIFLNLVKVLFNGGLQYDHGGLRRR